MIVTGGMAYKLCSHVPRIFYSIMKYKIQIECVHGWDDFERSDPDVDDSPPVTYDSAEEAQTEILKFILDSQFANSKGYLETSYCQDELRVVPV